MLTFEQIMEIAGKHDTEKNAGLCAFAREVILAERERCAKVLRECRDLLSSFESCSRNNFASLAAEMVEDIDAAIRKGETP